MGFLSSIRGMIGTSVGTAPSISSENLYAVFMVSYSTTERCFTDRQKNRRFRTPIFCKTQWNLGVCDVRFAQSTKICVIIKAGTRGPTAVAIVRAVYPVGKLPCVQSRLEEEIQHQKFLEWWTGISSHQCDLATCFWCICRRQCSSCFPNHHSFLSMGSLFVNSIKLHSTTQGTSATSTTAEGTLLIVAFVTSYSQWSCVWCVIFNGLFDVLLVK